MAITTNGNADWTIFERDYMDMSAMKEHYARRMQEEVRGLQNWDAREITKRVEPQEAKPAPKPLKPKQDKRLLLTKGA